MTFLILVRSSQLASYCSGLWLLLRSSGPSVWPSYLIMGDLVDSPGLVLVPGPIAGIMGQPINGVGTSTALIWKELSVFGSIFGKHSKWSPYLDLYPWNECTLDIFDLTIHINRPLRSELANFRHSMFGRLDLLPPYRWCDVSDVCWTVARSEVTRMAALFKVKCSATRTLF